MKRTGCIRGSLRLYACDGDTDCADDNDREDDNMSPHLPLLIELLNLNTLERADLGMYRRLLDITKEEEEKKEDKEENDGSFSC